MEKKDKIIVFCAKIDGFDFHVIVMNKENVDKLLSKASVDVIRRFTDIEPIDNFALSLLSFPIDKGLAGDENMEGCRMFILSNNPTKKRKKEHGIRCIRSYCDDFGIFCSQGIPINCPILPEERCKVISRFLNKKKKTGVQTLIHHSRCEYDILRTGNSFIIFEAKKTVIFIHCEKGNGDMLYVKYIALTPTIRSNILLTMLLHQSSFDASIMNFMNMLKSQTNIEIFMD